MRLLKKILLGALVLLALAFTALAVAISYDSDCGPRPGLSAGGETMKAVTYRCYGGPEVLEYGDVPKPEPGDTELLVKVHSAAVNPLDWHYMRGSPYFMRLGTGLGAPDDQRLGVDFAGTVVAKGQAVDTFEVGDEVFGAAAGAYADYLVVDAGRGVTAKPSNIGFDEAAAIPIAAVTALQALRDKGRLEPGQKVLINGASGGVGTFAVQIAKAMGAEVSGVCSTRNVKLVRSLGADHVFDYKKENYTESGERFDLIVDMVGNHSLTANLRVMAPEGRFVIVGGENGDWLGPLKRPVTAGFLNPFYGQEFMMLLAQMKQEDLATLAELMESGQVKSRIDRRFPLEHAADAVRYSETGRAQGKIIISVD